MTREELKANCERQIKECEIWAGHNGEKPSGRIYEENKLILELLEQEEPCEDTISRQAVLDGFWALDVELRPSVINTILNMIEHLPPVNPKPKTGRWIKDKEQVHVEYTYHCSECEYTIFGSERSDYCPGCGAEMIEP